MAITLDATSASTAQTNVSSITKAHTVSSGANRFMVVCVGCGNSQQVNSVTFGVTSLTKLVGLDGGGAGRSEMWYLANPNVGSANVVVTFSSSTARAGMGTSTWFGVETTNPFNTYDTENVATTPDITLTTTVDNCIMIDALYHAQETSVKDTDQTYIFRVTPDSSDTIGASYKAAATAGSNHMNWSVASGHSYIVAALQPYVPKGAFILGMI